jgi:hypothetical protein
MDFGEIGKMKDVPDGVVFAQARRPQNNDPTSGSGTYSVPERLAQIIRILFRLLENRNAKMLKFGHIH